jgi:HPt (histidine-containing phosphotransfer) domain-containing protein
MPNDVLPPPHAALRKRLRDIFRGDDARVEATITLALTSLRDGTENLKAALDLRDASAASRIAHKLKGVAMEIGLVEIAETARQLETAIRANDWDAAATAFQRFANSIAVESEHAESGAR